MSDALPFVGNPAAFVDRLPITTLAEAVAGDHPFAYLDNDYQVRFRCPECHHVDHNGGTAEVLDGWRWKCRRCDRSWTRYRLARHVLEDAEVLDRAYRIVEAEHAAS